MSIFSKAVLPAVLLAAILAAPVYAPAADSVALGRTLYQVGEQGMTQKMGLLVACLDHPDRHIRRIAVHAMGKLNLPEALPYLTRVAKDPSQPAMVRCTAVCSLSCMGDPTARATIRSLCGSDDKWLQMAATKSLQRMAQRRP